MKLHSFISRLQELNTYLVKFHLNTEGQETVPLPADEIMDIIYHSMPTTWKNNMIEQDSIMQILLSKKRLIYLKLG